MRDALALRNASATPPACEEREICDLVTPPASLLRNVCSALASRNGVEVTLAQVSDVIHDVSPQSVRAACVVQFDA